MAQDKLKLSLKNYSKFIIILAWSNTLIMPVFSQVLPKEVAKKYIDSFDHTQTIEVTDNVAAEKNNSKLEIYKFKNKLVGFSRSFETTTGCDSECLPLNFTLFYNSKGEYKDLYSKEGLTKKYHIPFTQEDYAKLNLLLVMAPKIFDTITHPKQMTDAISGATLKEYTLSVVETAAYTTLRVHLYNQETLNHIKKYLDKSP